MHLFQIILAASGVGSSTSSSCENNLYDSSAYCAGTLGVDKSDRIIVLAGQIGCFGTCCLDIRTHDECKCDEIGCARPCTKTGIAT